MGKKVNLGLKVQGPGLRVEDSDGLDHEKTLVPPPKTKGEKIPQLVGSCPHFAGVHRLLKGKPDTPNPEHAKPKGSGTGVKGSGSRPDVDMKYEVVGCKGLHQSRV